MDVVGALQKCIRIMVTAETTLTQQEIIHVYKEKAVQLRPDLQN
jgi:chorismate mutase